jgi:hypothetical protein
MIVRLLFSVFLLSTVQQLEAQIGYGRPYFALELQWQAEREKMNVKTIHTYTYNDSLQIEDSAINHYIKHFNKNGQLIVYKWLKRNTLNDKMKPQVIDSISYTDGGIFKEKRKFVFKGDNYKQTYRATASINTNGQIDTLFMHGKNDVLEAIRVYKYNRSKKIDSTYTYRVKTKKLSTKHSFKYDRKGNLVIRSVKTISGFSLTLLHYTKDSLLDSYIETYANAKETGRTLYTYDANKRLVRWNYNTNYYYYNNLYWFYKDGSRLPYSSYMESPKSKDDQSIAYNYETYKYEYFD